MAVAEKSACPRWYAYTRRICGGAVNLVNALHSGFWMGVLRDKTFQNYDVHPHQLVSSHDRRLFSRTDLEPWQQRCLTNHFRQRQFRPVDCRRSRSGNGVAPQGGHGRWMQLDFSREMIDTANRFLDEKGLSGACYLDSAVRAASTRQGL